MHDGPYTMDYTTKTFTEASPGWVACYGNAAHLAEKCENPGSQYLVTQLPIVGWGITVKTHLPMRWMAGGEWAERCVGKGVKERYVMPYVYVGSRGCPAIMPAEDESALTEDANGDYLGFAQKERNHGMIAAWIDMQSHNFAIERKMWRAIGEIRSRLVQRWGGRAEAVWLGKGRDWRDKVVVRWTNANGTKPIDTTPISAYELKTTDKSPEEIALLALASYAPQPGMFYAPIKE